MSEVLHYKSLALEWQPDAAESGRFKRILIVALATFFALVLFIKLIKVPPAEIIPLAKPPAISATILISRPTPAPVAPVEQKPEAPPTPIVQPEPLPQTPVSEPKPAVIDRAQREAMPEKSAKSTAALPSHATQIRDARSAAQKKGLLALGNEMHDLTDTSAVEANINKKFVRNDNTSNSTNPELSAPSRAHPDVSVISSGVAKSGGAVDAEKLTGNVGNTQLQARASSNQTNAVTERDDTKRAIAASAKKTSGSNGRASEDITIVIDQNKAGLQSLYERYRRKNAALKGKVIFQITIDETGKVIDVKIVSSELGDVALEQQFASRIKMYVFEKSSDTVTITYPIEFLP